MERLKDILSNLGPGGDRVEVLEGIKPALSALSRKDMEDGLKDVDLCPIFECLQTTDPRLVQTAVDVLHHLLNLSDPALVLERYGGLMLEGLTSSSAPDCVVLLVLKQAKRCCLDDDLVRVVIKQSLVPPIISKLGAELAVSAEVTKVVVTMADTRPGLEVLTSADTVSQLAGVMETSSVLRMRVLDTLVMVAQLSQEHLQAVERTGLLGQLVASLHTSDLLLQLNTLELLTKLAITSHGLSYLESAGVMGSLATMLQDCPNLPFSEVILPGLVKFWGNVAHLKPRSTLSRYPGLVPALASSLHSEDPALRTIGLDTLAYVGVSLEGKEALAELGNIMLECVDQVGVCLVTKTTKLAALSCLASLLKVDPQHLDQGQVVATTRAWWQRIPNCAQVVASDAKLPFLDIRLEAYQLLYVVCGQGWGRRAVMAQPGLCEYLLDRTSESDASARESRWRVLGRLVEGREAKEMLGPEMDTSMRTALREGPHYTPVETQVAYEEQQ